MRTMPGDGVDEVRAMILDALGTTRRRRPALVLPCAGGDWLVDGDAAVGGSWRGRFVAGSRCQDRADGDTGVFGRSRLAALWRPRLRLRPFSEALPPVTLLDVPWSQ